ncbi:FISUMP domain-containing protein [Fibrobacter succinogenes]|uniref:FISUMP domain-containing protein n=1 Tax=Fibrobacter succinogenes TaxID=833 RepID=UPI0026F2F533|nr:FISUMP domain-containing protein [Fibrobacter succinogenes]
MLSKNPLKSLLPLLGVAAFVAFSACSDNNSHPLIGPEEQIESSDLGKSSSSTDAKSSSSSKAKSSSSSKVESSSSADAESSMPSPKLPSVGSSSSLQTSSSAVSLSSEAGVTACKTANVDNCKYGTLTDERDGQTYKTIKIGSQTWMAENLNYAYLEPTEDLDSSSFCFGNDPAKCDTLGRLYLWSAAMDSAGKLIEPANGCGYGVYCSASGTSEAIRGICPAGWHLPSREELDTLAKVGELGLMFVSGWLNIEGVDSVGFSGLPSGYMVKETFLYDHAAFWSSTDISKGYLAYAFSLPDIPAATLASLGPSKAGEAGKYVAYSVRCVKD